MKTAAIKSYAVAWMWTSAKIAGNGKPSTYGLGFGVLTIDGETYVAHSGGQQGTSPYLAIVPGKHFAVAAVQHAASEAYKVRRGLQLTFTGGSSCSGACVALHASQRSSVFEGPQPAPEIRGR